MNRSTTLMPSVRTVPVVALALGAALTLTGEWGAANTGDEAMKTGDAQPVVIQIVASTHVQGAYKPCT